MFTVQDIDDDTFPELTEAQLEALELIGRGLTTKQIAHELGLTESGATKRVETLRAKFGGITKNELGVIAREAQDSAVSGQGKKLTGKKTTLASPVFFPPSDSPNDAGSQLLLRDAQTFDARSPWAADSEPHVVPEELDGKDATWFRLKMAMKIALGMAVVLLVMLAVANSVETLVM